VAIAVLAALFVFLELRPDLLFRNTTANGGDTGAHVWWPWYFAHHLLPKLRLAGWSPDYYAGLPIGNFYFPIPALIITALNVVLPYNIAFKLVTVLGPVSLPIAAYVFARGIKAPDPAPPLFAAATLPYLFYTGYTIWGGNIASTLAGEFSFSIAISCTLVFLGLFARALDERRRLALPAVFLALALMSHVIVAYFAIASALVLWLQRRPLRNLRVAGAIGIIGGMVTALWSLPLVGRLAYTTDMGWAKETKYLHELFPPQLRWAALLAGVAVIAGVAFLRRHTIGLLFITTLFGLAFRLAPEGRLWNARLLPFYYLTLLFLAACGVAELIAIVRYALDPDRGVVAFFQRTSRFELDPFRDDYSAMAREDGGEAVTLDLDDHVPADRPPPWRMPAFAADAVSGIVVLALLGGAMWYAHDHRAFLPSWTSWNESGYESKPAYPEFKEVIDTMAALPPGRALWETGPGRDDRSINDYGTTLALELLPYFTNGRISSMEGLYFETSATTPYHFLTVAEVAKRPSNPVRGLAYHTLKDFELGVKHMQLMGVRYYMAASDDTDANGTVDHGAKWYADQSPNLRFITETGTPGVEPKVARWRIYEVLHSATVSPLAYEPVVLEGTRPKQWLAASTAWFGDERELDRPLVAGGPQRWMRATAQTATFVDRRPLPPVKVSHIRSGDDTVRFHVSRTGVPVLVKTSFFPNWKASGARGPWRASPNFMVVIPTRHDVTLHYGRNGLDWLGILLSVFGLLGLAGLARWRPAPLPEPRRWFATGEPDDDDGGSWEAHPDEDPELVPLR
jgi:hypothetical protein